MQILCYAFTLKVYNYAVHYVSVMYGRFQTGIVNVRAHALNLNNQYHTLLKVYKSAALNSTLQTVLVICTISFRVVQLMYRLIR